MNHSTVHNYKITRVIHQLDAADQVSGRLATQIAKLLMGKHKPDYSPQTDCGDFVVVSHAAELKFTGKKLDQKEYIRHTGHPGGIRRTPVATVMATKPALVIEKAVYNMLPKNRLRAKMMARLSF
ncbi:MAG: 50S ribosomal protein L13, partial [Patescibacteria group bacterium]